VLAIDAKDLGSVWVGTLGGIVRLEGSKQTDFTQANGAPGSRVTGMG